MVAIQKPVSRYTSEFFSFDLTTSLHQVELQMQFADDCISTSQLPGTYQFLSEHAPSVLECQCFNWQAMTFAQEVQATETAHLFEHILLDQLCYQKSADADADYDGTTEWDWSTNPVGSFTVILSVPQADRRYFAQALNDAIRLMAQLHRSVTS